MRVERVEKIFSDGRHNAFTNIEFWKGRYYLVFRSAATHSAYPPGQITMLESADTRCWSSSVVIDTEWDDRDPKLLATGQHLYVYATALALSGEHHDIRTLVSFTANGRQWSESVPAYEHGYSFWKPKAHGRVYYAAADVDDSPPETPEEERGRVELLRSEDGLNWQPISIITQGNKCTETSLVFLKDDSLLAMTRQNASPYYARFLRSWPPYHEWDYVEGTFFFQGPAAALIGDTIVVAGRIRAKEFESAPDERLGDRRTALFTFNLEDMRLEWQANLPTQWGGDLSYPGILALADDRVLASFYDGKGKREGQSDVFLATITL